MSKLASRAERRKKRQFRIRKKIKGTQQSPRLSVFRSARHIYVQAVDDTAGRTLAAAGTLEKDLGGTVKGSRGNKGAAAVVGKAIADRLKKLGVDKAYFDRGGNRYAGRVRTLAEAAREGGLKF